MGAVFNFGIDVKKSNFTDVDSKDLNPKKVFENVLVAALRAKYTGGLEGSKGRCLARLLYKVDDAEGTTIDLERQERALLEEAFCDDGIKLDISIYRIVEQYHQELTKSE